jgi:hypothetical protein
MLLTEKNFHTNMIFNSFRGNFKFTMLLNDVPGLKFPITSVYLVFIDQKYFLSLEVSIPKKLQKANFEKRMMKH